MSLSRLAHALPQPSQPHVFFPALAVFVLAYYALAPAYPAARQRAWILTALSSLGMTLVSLPFLADYLAAGLSVHAVRPHPRALPPGLPLARWANSVFQAYLVVDLIIGAVHYRKHVNFLSGWVHHSLYIIVNELALRRSWAHIFALCSIMELPTFILALGTLHPALRSDALFALAFFSTRIALHLRVLAAYASRSARGALLGGSALPAAILALAFGMHALWFVQCVRGNVRRWRKSRGRGRAGAKVVEAAAAGVATEEANVHVHVMTGVEVKKGADADVDVGVTVLDPGKLEVIVEPAPAPVPVAVAVPSLSASLPELYRPTSSSTSTTLSGSGRSDADVDVDDARMSRSELGVRASAQMQMGEEVRVRIRTRNRTRAQTQTRSAAATLSSSPRSTQAGVASSPLTSSTPTNASTTAPTQPTTAQPRPLLPRLPSLERALQTLERLRARARVRGVYDRLPLPDRRVLYAYVGLGLDGARERARRLRPGPGEGPGLKMVGVY